MCLPAKQIKGEKSALVQYIEKDIYRVGYVRGLACRKQTKQQNLQRQVWHFRIHILSLHIHHQGICLGTPSAGSGVQHRGQYLQNFEKFQN